MTFLKIFFMIAMILFMAIPFVIEYFRFRKDEKTLTVSRFRLVVFTGIYAIATAILLGFFSKIVSWFGSLGIVKWVLDNLGTSRTEYTTRLYTVIFINIALGFGFCFLQSFMRIGLSKTDVTTPKKMGAFTRGQKFERNLIARFDTGEGYFIGRLLYYLSLVLSLLFAVMFLIFQIPAVFGADWIPYQAISVLFQLNYQYPVIGLLCLWEISFFLLGIRALTHENPRWKKEETMEKDSSRKDLIAKLDETCKNEYQHFYAASMELEGQDLVYSTNHEPISDIIKEAVQNDPRNGKIQKDIYVRALDELERTDNSILFNGGFFSEFSMYFFRYLSVRLARGDNLIFVCNNDNHSESVKQYLYEGLSEISSLYPKSKDIKFDAALENPIWKIVAVDGTRKDKDILGINSSSILVTSLDFLCSGEFEKFDNFVLHVDSVIFTDIMNCISFYEKHLSLLNTKFLQMTKNEARNSIGSRPIRYFFFDETRTPGMNESLKNIFFDEIYTVDIMDNSYCPTVGFYHYELVSKQNPNGNNIQYTTHIPSNPNLSVMINMAIRCLAEKASSVSIFVDESLPYKEFMKSIDSYLKDVKDANVVLYKNNGQNNDTYNTNNKKYSTMFINEYYYNPDHYSVILALDAGNNLPSALRKYVSMTTDQPSLVILFSVPYLFRDYYVQNMKQLWKGDQILRIPNTEKTEKDIAKKILMKANSGGISQKELFELALKISDCRRYVKSRNINKILEKLLYVFDIECDGPEIYQYFEYTSIRDFNQMGEYETETKITLVSKHLLYDIIQMQDHIKLEIENGKSFDMPLPKNRLTQNYIAGQNFIYQGEMYLIKNIDVENGIITAKYTSNGTYRYVQLRTYRLDRSSGEIKYLHAKEKFPISQSEQNTESKIKVSLAEIVAFKVPAEVCTKGYYGVNPQVMDRTYYSYSDDVKLEQDDFRAIQTYRRYGMLENAEYAEDIYSDVYLNAYKEGLSVLSVKLYGSFGESRAQIAALAAVMLDEILRSKYPSVADSLAVCAVNGARDPILRYMPELEIISNEKDDGKEIELLILEDCASDLGVISDLMELGGEFLQMLFQPIKDYLDWYMNKKDRSDDYLWFGLKEEPKCFDFSALHEISDILCKNNIEVQYVDIAEFAKTYVCDFCGKRYANENDVKETVGERLICCDCEKELVGNNKDTLDAYLNRAKMFMENTYGIKMDDAYKICFESTVKIINDIKRNENVRVRNTNIPAKSYIRGKTVNLEYDLPGANLSELLVRELTHVWQINNLPDDVSEDVAKGHIAFVGIQYLNHLKKKDLASRRKHYYETSSSGAAAGYRILKSGLTKNPQYHNNPFRYLLEDEEGSIIPIPDPKRTLPDPKRKHGDTYQTDQIDRFPDNLSYFYYERLPESWKNSYNQALEALREYRDEIQADGFENAETAKTVLSAITHDHPELFWYTGAYIYRSDGVVVPSYGVTEAEANALQEQMDSKIAEYLEDITPDMSAYDTALNLYVKLINNVDYDTIALNAQKEKTQEEDGSIQHELDRLRTICGVFLDGKAVCAGYARAYQYLLQKCGVECAECSGYLIKKDGSKTDTGHAWNIVKLDGEYYHLDATWDDHSNTIQEVKDRDIGFNYFCVTTEEMKRTRNFDLAPVEIPDFRSTKCNYYYHNNLVLTSYDVKKIKAILTSAVEKGEAFCTFKCATQDLFAEVYDKLFTNMDQNETIFAAGKKINPDAKFSYNHSDDMLTITIYIQ